jgi:hypothetical protein
MTTAATRVRKIAEREGFDIVVTHKGVPISLKQNGTLGPYDFARKMKGSATVSEWKSQRFEATYPGYKCDVLRGDGAGTATGQMTLETLRSTYPEEDR